MSATFDLFSLNGAPAKAKLVYLGSPDSRYEALMNRVRSLQIEHVSPAGIMRREISRRSGHAGTNEASILAAMRKWFFARKPDAGFVLTDFPATLLQAKVLDEWLEARDESIDAVVEGQEASASLVTHYRTLGTLFGELGTAV
jgi:adenylate kinase